MAKKDFRAKTQIQANVYLESHRGRRREPAGLCGLKKQIIEAKEGPLELRRKKGKENTPGVRLGKKSQTHSRENTPVERRGWGKAWVFETERERERAST